MSKLLDCPICENITAHEQMGYNALTNEGLFKCGVCGNNQTIIIQDQLPFR